MRAPRNPFRLRAADRIHSDAAFVRLFGPQCLKLLESARDRGEQLVILRSAEGGGKTSLMRLFTPRVLLALHKQRTEEDQRELFTRLAGMGVVSDRGVHCLGVLLSLANDYEAISALDLDEGRRARIFFALLNARVLLAAVAGALDLMQTTAADLASLRVEATGATGEAPYGLQLPATGDALVRWATSVETEIYELMDSFEFPGDRVTGHDTPFVLHLLTSDRVRWNGAPFVDHVQVMLDDVHKLARDQRDRLLRTIIDARAPVGVWLGQRFEALSETELLSSGAETGRDIGAVVKLEQFWRRERSVFEKFTLEIATRRAEAAAGVEISSFGSHLALVPVAEVATIDDAVAAVEARVRALANGSALFQEWIRARAAEEDEPWSRAVSWRALEILIERERRKPQRRLFDESIFEGDAPEAQDDSSVRNAAELFLSREVGLPYYYGPQRLCALASWNVQQFLAVAGDQFEEMLAASLLRKSPDLTPSRQDAIVRKASEQFWADIPRRVQEGRAVQRLLDAIGEFAASETYLPNAPYSPGVTGIAITMADRESLRAAAELRRGPSDLALLARCISLALAHNLLEPLPDHRGQGENLMVLYLNRLLCVRYELPLHYGGYRRRKLTELAAWATAGLTNVERRLV